MNGGEYPPLGSSVGRWAYVDGKRGVPPAGSAERPVAADGFGLVVESGRGNSGSTATAAARPSAGQGVPSRSGRAGGTRARVGGGPAGLATRRSLRRGRAAT